MQRNSLKNENIIFLKSSMRIKLCIWNAVLDKNKPILS